MGSDGKDKIQKNKFNGKTAEPPLSPHTAANSFVFKR